MGKVQLQIRMTDDMIQVLDQYLKINTRFSTRGAWFVAAAQEWLDWIETEEGKNYTVYSSHSRGPKVSVSVPPELKERFRVLAGERPLGDMSWTVVVWYAKRYDLLENVSDSTPGLIQTSASSEQAELIDAYIKDGTFASKGAFWTAALEYWLEHRSNLELPHDYYPAPPVGEDTVPLFTVFPRNIHSRLKLWADADDVYPRVIVYNAVSLFLTEGMNS
jgi:hypothetical protein